MTGQISPNMYEPSFEEISNRDSPYYDENWFESELLPEDHEWFSIIGDFLLMRAMIRRYEYAGKNQALAVQQRRNLYRFNNLIPEIEDLIRGEYECLEFVEKWADFKKTYDACRVVKKTEAERAKQGRFNRGVEQRRAWFATVYLQEKNKGKNGAIIKRDIAKFAELIKKGDIEPPHLWNELKFDKILSKDSKITSPLLNYRDYPLSISIAKT
jgi:hypothetical protein